MIVRLFLVLLSFLSFFLLTGCKSDVKVKGNCGDGFVDPGEECDGSNLADQTCGTLGHYFLGGTLSCLPDCTFDRSDCGGFCGDGELDDGHGEVCDGTDFGDQTCSTLGFHGGFLQCTNTCEFDTSVCSDVGSCGDGIIQENYGEICDTDSLDGATCESLGFTRGTLACSDTCEYDTSACIADCGNDLVDANEDCDGAELADQTCASLGHYNVDGTLLCLPDCTFDRSDCGGICGDLTIQGEEACDGLEVGGATCGSLGYAGGNLGCGSDCRYDVSACNPWLAVDAGNNHTCAIAADHSLWCWGDNQYGQLGTGDITDSLVPVAVSGMAANVIAVATGGGHTCAIKTGNSLWCWGRNQYGQLGIGSTTDKLTPTLVPSESFATIRLGSFFSCGIKTNGTVACWGLNASGQVGLSDNNQHSPYTVGAVSGGLAVGCGGQHACAVNSSGNGYCWGADYIGQLADGTISNSYPHQVSIISAVDLALGETHTCYLSSSAGMFCAGENTSGQLGMGTISSQTSPVAVSGMVNSTRAIDADFKTTCAVKTDGSVRCWGLNDHGQLGTGTLSSSNIPAQVTGLTSGFSVVRVGRYHTCALSDSGYLMCWGENEDGQLGDGTTTDQRTPISVGF
ncbi:hypothetical protein KKD52_01840 [Myxococcota bacterium]|nr:hypothetical protein [Myxococcota bacterium]MBU1411601.1 hypothetical protein [Myxococcota bacterium]MBU1509075.1 hypothetical protein [Myxococcota bacterium]